MRKVITLEHVIRIDDENPELCDKDCPKLRRTGNLFYRCDLFICFLVKKSIIDTPLRTLNCLSKDKVETKIIP